MTSGWTSRRSTFDAWVPRLRRLRAWVGRIGRRARAPRDPPWRGWATRGARRRWGRWCSARRCPPWVPSRPVAPRTARAARRLARRPAPRPPRSRPRSTAPRDEARATTTPTSETRARLQNARADAPTRVGRRVPPRDHSSGEAQLASSTLGRCSVFTAAHDARALLTAGLWGGIPAGLRAIRGGAIDRSQTERGETDRDS